ncbi:MAG: hypothetical protein LHW57_00370 [Candidatus Cloacimonetes bacterium]|nr:hypothetical protein [Candidatus Cloacimonadota bacterium]
MRKMVLAAVLLLVIGALAANVVIPRAVERVWFDAFDNFWVRFGPEADAYDVDTLSFSTSYGSYNFPYGFTLPPELPYELNFSQVIPGFAIDRAEDHFTVDTDPYWDPGDESVSWGPQNDWSVRIHPLTAGQSVVQLTVPDMYYDGYYDQALVWAKDSGTDYPYPYCPATLCTLSVQVNDSEGGPASQVPIYLNYGYVYDIGWPDGRTNSNGWWQAYNFRAQRTWIVIRDPNTGAWVYDQIHFPEPAEHIHIEATVSYSEVPQDTQISGTLALSPSVLGTASGHTLHLEYRSELPLNGPARLGLYDLRGRWLAARDMPREGYTDWDLPELANGVYFIRLSGSKGPLVGGRITVIK